MIFLITLTPKKTDIGVIQEIKQALNKYLKTLSNLSYKRFLDGKGNNKYGYKGIEVK